MHVHFAGVVTVIDCEEQMSLVMSSVPSIDHTLVDEENSFILTIDDDVKDLEVSIVHCWQEGASTTVTKSNLSNYSTLFDSIVRTVPSGVSDE